MARLRRAGAPVTPRHVRARGPPNETLQRRRRVTKSVQCGPIVGPAHVVVSSPCSVAGGDIGRAEKGEVRWVMCAQVSLGSHVLCALWFVEKLSLQLYFFACLFFYELNSF